MKRLLLIASVLCGAALIPLAAQAQRGGMGMGARGGMGFGGHGGVVSSRVGFTGRPPGRAAAMGAIRPAGVRTTGMRSRVMIPGQRAFSPNRFAFDQFHHFHHFHNGFNNGFFNNCFNGFGGFNTFGFGGFGCGSPFLSGGFGFPFLGGWEEPAPPPQQQQPVAVENQGDDRAARELAFEVQALRDEMQAMRSAEEARNQARNNPPARSEPESASAVLVFRDGRQLTARNYAISDHTIWVLSPNNARKFPVSDLDVQATEQANAKNGVEFRLPH